MTNDKKSTKFENLILLCMCCVLFSGSSVLASYMNIFLIFILILVSVTNMAEKKIQIFSKFVYNKIILMIITFWLLLLPVSISLVESLKYIIIFCVLYLISLMFKDRNGTLKKLMSYILTFSIILATSIILSQFIDNFCIRFFPFMLPKRESSLNMYYSELRNGIYSGLAFERAFAATSLTLGISVLYTKIIQDKKNNKTNFILLLILFVALFSTGKRMHLLINIFNLLLIFFINMNKKNMLKAIKLAIPLILFLIIILIKIPTAQKVFIRFFDGKSNYTVQSRQENFWNYCIEIFENKPLVGSGVNTFVSYIQARSTGKIYNAHNIYLQILAENGVIGFGLFGILFVMLFVKSIKLLKIYHNNTYLNQIINYAILLQSTFLIYGLSGNTLYYTSQLLFYFIAIIFINNAIYKGENNEKNINNNVS